MENRENNNVVLLKHHNMNVKYTNTYYTNQVDDNLEDYVIVDVTSRCVRNKEFMSEHPTFAKDLSPFYVGPVISSDGVKSEVFEIFWQCGKVYPCHDENGKPNAEFFKWRNNLYSQRVCSKDLMRHACNDLGYTHKDTRYFAYFDKTKNEYIPLNYVESRKKVYIPEYAKLVYNTESFKWLKSIVDSGKKVALVDFDGYNYYSERAKSKLYESYSNKCKKENRTIDRKLEDFTKISNIKEVINCPYLLAGHGFVLKMLLEGDIEVKDGVVVDNIGVL